jgi:hypothetical protein
MYGVSAAQTTATANPTYSAPEKKHGAAGTGTARPVACRPSVQSRPDPIQDTNCANACALVGGADIACKGDGTDGWAELTSGAGGSASHSPLTRRVPALRLAASLSRPSPTSRLQNNASTCHAVGMDGRWMDACRALAGFTCTGGHQPTTDGGGNGAVPKPSNHPTAQPTATRPVSVWSPRSDPSRRFCAFVGHEATRPSLGMPRRASPPLLAPSSPPHVHHLSG